MFRSEMCWEELQRQEVLYSWGPLWRGWGWLWRARGWRQQWWSQRLQGRPGMRLQQLPPVWRLLPRDGRLLREAPGHNWRAPGASCRWQKDCQDKFHVNQGQVQNTLRFDLALTLAWRSLDVKLFQCSIASECLVNVQWSCMRNHAQIFVTYVQWGSRAGPIFVVNDQWGEWLVLIFMASDLLGANPCKSWNLSVFFAQRDLFWQKSSKGKSLNWKSKAFE